VRSASFGCCALAAGLIASAAPGSGQELEARSYSAAPIDTNFALGTYSNSKGNVSLDPSLPLSDVRATVNAVGVGYIHTFRLANRTASWAILVPYLGANIAASVYGQPQSGSRSGFPDMRARFAIELLGHLAPTLRLVEPRRGVSRGRRPDARAARARPRAGRVFRARPRRGGAS